MSGCERCAELVRQLAEARATNRRLQRRVQQAEAALGEWQQFTAAAKEQRTGRAFPAMMAYALVRAEEENSRLSAELHRARFNPPSR